MGEVEWERARLFPVSGIGGADEQERRASSALLAVIQSVREFGRALTVPMGAPAGRLSTFIEVPFDDGDKKLRPDGLIQVVSGHRTWTALVEIKTGRHDLIPGQIESYMDVARRQKFDALLTISNQVVALSCNAGPARGQGRGSFVDSVLTAVDRFYSDVVQHIKPWAPAPPKVKESEAVTPDEPIPEDEILAGGGNGDDRDPGQELVSGSLATASHS